MVDVTARNTTPPTTSGNIITRYFFEELHFALQPEAAHARATQDGHALATATDSRQGYIQLAITLRSKLNFDQTTRVRLTYDLPGGKPRSKSDIRVGAAFATFYAWVNGDRAAIRILLPDSFEPSQTGEAMVETHEGNKLVYSADGITDTAHWYAAINADRPAGLRSEALTIPTGEQVTVLAWPEDGEWLDRVADRLRRGLPQLDRLIGLPWPVTGSLVVTEVHTPLLEGYSGLFHPDTGGIEISEDLDDLTIVHEASHAWFNSSLFTGRWINEGLANTYGTKALKGIRIDSPPPFEYSRTDPAAFALNDWPPLGRISDEKTEAREDYGYQTSFRVVDAIVGLAGDDGMRKVFAAAAAREIAYVGAPPAEHRPARRRLADPAGLPPGASPLDQRRERVPDECCRAGRPARARHPGDGPPGVPHAHLGRPGLVAAHRHSRTDGRLGLRHRDRNGWPRARRSSTFGHGSPRPGRRSVWTRRPAWRPPTKAPARPISTASWRVPRRTSTRREPSRRPPVASTPRATP